MSEDGEWFTPEDIATMFSIDFWMEHSKFSRKIDQMKMTKEEVAILKALTVISPGNAADKHIVFFVCRRF
ncbi:hypothetical protein DPMN_117269 [Dreissena polymorpha]|uniref:Uncharacterized protein n=1 Tax=Dreissena polymorpha TaxID=45954 RepID=A0A9D4KQK2_DREPO|nr:hypothetical protein DPMN_117269 [Dreissena polymorpha]